ncbi:MAG: proline--tRNA ligase [Helicobacteraceae bacterium]|nr:proline--tRNA ligase [Helicobacteraceae bacterium]
MKWSRSFIHTLKDDPKDAALKSHKLLARAGFISQSAAGIYDFLPLGKKTLDKIRRVVKEELDNAGCQEVSLGVITPSELWQESGRFMKYGKELLRFKDRKGGDYVLSPTNEEAMVALARGRVSSYKQLPLNLYQINTKFRDEARPRFGLMRGREFLMKDGYSFHATEEDMLREFALMEATYRRIFTRLGLDFRAVEADSGAIGGSGSKEFMVLADAGEDTIVVCESCDYGANIEAACRAAPKYADFAVNFDGEIHTPNIAAIADLAEFLKIPARKTIKAVVKKALYDNGAKICLFFTRGNDELEETKALNAANANELADDLESDLASVGLSAIAGFIGIDFAQKDILKFVDSELANEVNMITGANKKDYHKVCAKITESEYNFRDLIAVQKGDICKRCGGKLNYRSGIETGHIFQLREKYSKPLNATFLDENGKAKPFVMGTYGIGVSRLIAAILEQNGDEKGCVWGKEIAPYFVDIIVANIKDEMQKNLAEEIYEKLRAAKLDVIYDDRADSFGFKMKDFELIGFCYAIVVGKVANEGKVEVIDRKSGEKNIMDFAAAIEFVKKAAL